MFFTRDPGLRRKNFININVFGLVPYDESAFLNIEVPSVESAIPLVSALVHTVLKPNHSSDPGEREHVGDSQHGIKGVIERVAGVHKVERLRLELIQQVLRLAELRSNRGDDPEPVQRLVVLNREGVYSGDAQLAAWPHRTHSGHGSGADIK